MKCQKGKRCVKQPSTTFVSKYDKLCTGCDKTGKDNSKVNEFLYSCENRGCYFYDEFIAIRCKKFKKEKIKAVKNCQCRILFNKILDDRIARVRRLMLFETETDRKIRDDIIDLLEIRIKKHINMYDYVNRWSKQ